MTLVGIRGIVFAAVAFIDIVTGFVSWRSARRRFGVSTSRFVVVWVVVMTIFLGVPALIWSLQ